MEIIIGSVVSLFVEWLKSKTNMGEYQTLGAVLGVSIIGAIVYTFLVNVGYWQTVSSILITAGAFYTFVIARFKP